MSEEKKAAPAAKEAGAAKKEKKGATQNSREVVKKAKWTLQRCRKIARRFDTVEQWKFGAPSSYKSAEAHDWVKTIEDQVWNNPQTFTHKKAA
jgi:hypothetical protein